ncbi:MAG: M1 family aminopeptidase, partial [Bacteroidales bacterium]|nr:M1 family aminopeptidase [Bacteroidales bacterium]
MKKILSHPVLILLITIAAMSAGSCRPIDEAKYGEEGVSRLLAVYRKATIKDVSYRLSFTIPAAKEEPIEGQAIIEFTLSSKSEPLLLDFRATGEHLKSLVVNGKTIPPEINSGHIKISAQYLKRSYNKIEIKFRAGDMSLNRNDDFLYTLFVPDRASTAFPCIDQPDIKARYNLTLDIPLNYRAMSNSPAISSDTTGNRVRIRFSETKPISTYLFAFAAGKFDLIEKEIDGVRMEMLHRETRRGYIENNADEIFRLHLSSIRWLERYSDIIYPFDKFGFVLIPSFQYSGMEHPGSIFYRASSLLLEESPTLNEKLSRASLIAHETSHIWFGDLVTMKWFDDVWLKEVFAGYMADKIVNPDFPDINHDLRFFLSRYPAAYSVDRTRGSNPVIQQLDNLKNAGSLYGAIIYNK